MKQTQKEQIMLALLQRGYLVTAQRRLLITELCGKKEITNVEDFWLQLRRNHGIGWATVYNNINLLMSIGWLVREGKGVENAKYILLDKPIKVNEEMYIDKF